MKTKACSLSHVDLTPCFYKMSAQIVLMSIMTIVEPFLLMYDC